MHTPPNKSTSAWVDPVLGEYLHIHRERNRFESKQIGTKPDPELILRLGAKRMGSRTGQISMPAPGAAVYPPTSYIPQAVGLWLGSVFHWQVSTTYTITKLLSLLSAAVIWFISLSLSSPNPLLLTLLCLPISLSQLASASLDGVSTSLAMLAVTLYQNIQASDPRRSRTYHFLLTILTILVVPCRLHLWPLLILPFLSARHLSTRTGWLATIASTSIILAWIKSVTGSVINSQRLDLSKDASGTALYFLINPDAFLTVFLNTLANTDNLVFYAKSFIGILGRGILLEPANAYDVFAVLLAIALTLTVSWAIRRPRDLLKANRLLFCCIAFASTISVFFLLLISWTPNPVVAKEIAGIQGRYFVVPAMILTKGLCTPTTELSRPINLFCSYGMGFTVLAFSTYLILGTL